jgi:hypothetical protein
MQITLPNRNISITRTTAKRFQDAGRCIYCPDGKPPFTKEHIIPIGLGGGLILPQASCPKCQDIIKEVETYCMRGMFLPHRLANGLVRNLKDLGNTIPFKVIVGQRTITVRFPRKGVPDYLCMPDLKNPPGILVRRPPGPFQQFPIWVGGNQQRLRALNAIGNFVLLDNFDATKLFRVIAKIAHSYISAEIGLDNFNPMLPEFILGKDNDLGSYLIGRWPEDGMPQINGTCQIGMAFCEWGQQTLVNVRLRLFPSHHRIPIYHVVVGALTKPINAVLVPLGLETADPNAPKVAPQYP